MGVRGLCIWFKGGHVATDYLVYERSAVLTKNADMELWNKGSCSVGGLNLDVASNSSG